MEDFQLCWKQQKYISEREIMKEKETQERTVPLTVAGHARTYEIDGIEGRKSLSGLNRFDE